MDRLERRARDGVGELTTTELFSQASRLDIIGLFLAMLELTRQRKINVVQSDETGEIVLRAREPEPEAEEESAE